MITISLKDDDSYVGTIEEADLKLLNDQLVEESEEDTDYYITPATIELLERNGASAHLLSVLRQAVGGSDGVDVIWAET